MIRAARLPRRLARVLILAMLAALPALGAPRAEPAAGCPDGAGTAGVALPATARALREGRPLTIVAFGSSSTEGAGASAPERSYPARLEARLRAALPGAALRVLNRGRGGEEVSEMLARLDREVLAAAPTLVVWQAGANAVLRGMAPEAFRAAMVAGLARLQAAGADIVLMDNQRAPRIVANPNHAAFEAVMTSLAEDQAVPLFSRARLMRSWEAAGAPPAEFLVEDGLHHKDRGYDCLAAALSSTLVAALHTPSVVAGR
jgi:lysophospholipase L1-like esterase